MSMTATYSPDDNKLRLYSLGRLDKETYNRVHGAGFRWAPKQELFVAPMWTPDREDLLIELCGEIDDEDKSLVERSEERAERFEDYSSNRAKDAEVARASVSAIADNIPLGQPILVGHHSERHARKDAERIENGMRKAVKMWRQSEYWTSRAKGAIRHAKYKERPDVRARRIKGIEADKRKQERTKASAEMALRFWNGKLLGVAKDGTKTPIEITESNRDRICHILGSSYALSFYASCGIDGQSHFSGWDVLKPDEERYKNCPSMTVIELQNVAFAHYQQIIDSTNRWIEHYENRLAYEKAMLGESGGTVTDRTGPEVGGGCQCWASHRGGWSWIKKVNKISVTVWDNWGNSADLTGARNFTRNIPFDKLRAVMTKAQVDEARTEKRLIEMEDETGFFILQSREEFDKEQATPGLKPWTHLQPEPIEPPAAKTPEPTSFGKVQQNNMKDEMKAIEQTLKAGVQVVVANQLFPTPPDLAQRMVDEARIEPGNRILEPSAGTGNIVKAIRESAAGYEPELIAIEINHRLASMVLAGCSKIICTDFLNCNGDMGTFDRILMNPPFSNGDDIKHITHALTMLKPGGRLVAICANGPRQQEKLKPLASQWEELPEDTFKQQGTGVRTALLVIEA